MQKQLKQATKDFFKRGPFRNKRRQAVIDTVTGVTYESIRIAAEAQGLSYGYLRKMLTGVKPNTTSLRVLELN